MRQNHSVRVKKKAIGNDAQAINSVRNDQRVGGKEADNRAGKHDEHKSNHSQEHRVVRSRLPDGALGPFWIVCPERLAHHRRRCIRHAPRRQQRKYNHPDSDDVTRNDLGPKAGDDPRQPNPTGHADENLKSCSR